MRSGERMIWVASFSLTPWREGLIKPSKDGSLGPPAGRLLVSNSKSRKRPRG